RILQDLETNVHRPAGVTWAAFRALFTVAAVGPIAPAQLASLTSVSPASISSVLNTLERNKLVQRKPSAADGRSVLVNLTPKGRRAVRELVVRNNTREVAWMAALSDSERKALARLLHKLLAHRPAAPDTQSHRIIPAPKSRG
ncbi:MAG TPA: MarR family transcriptional regulator, partial [Solirubrobacteraceae bacterium]|nr:MarR family transcriptional regulator [Solirubrobacteraceae bacterium]